jgi:nucleotide-binding universal stress UspA family protein
MYRNLLVPLDGSPLAERALTTASGLATTIPGRVILIRVIPNSHATTEAGKAPEAVTTPEIEAYLATVAKRFGSAPVETVVAGGDPAQTILAQVAERGVDLIVMATHGRSGIGRWVFGSVADQVMRHSPVPALLVSATSPERAWPKGRAPRILVTLDYSALSEVVLEAAANLAKTIHGELLLFSVTPLLVVTDGYGQVYLPYDVDQDLIDRRRYLEETAAKLRERGLTVTTRAEFGTPNTLIVDVAREEDVDLIAMATHGSGGATRVLMGSMAAGVVQRATAPVLIVRPSEVREQESGMSSQEPGVRSQVSAGAASLV